MFIVKLKYDDTTQAQLTRHELMEAMSGVSDQTEFGKAQVSSTGSLRYNEGKPNMSNIPPEFLLGMAKIMTMGEKKYGKNNWKKGNKTSVAYDSAMRHILKWYSGESKDSESGDNHLFHAAVNLMMCWYYETNYPEMDDRTEETK